jgi:hypothetical protein
MAAVPGIVNEKVRSVIPNEAIVMRMFPFCDPPDELFYVLLLIWIH